MNLKSFFIFSFVALLLNGGPVSAVEAPQKMKAKTNQSQPAQHKNTLVKPHQTQRSSGNEMKSRAVPSVKHQQKGREVPHTMKVNPATLGRSVSKTKEYHPSHAIVPSHTVPYNKTNQRSKAGNVSGAPIARKQITTSKKSLDDAGNQINIADAEGLGKLISEMSLSVNIEDVWSVCSSSVCKNNPSDCVTESICVNGDCQELTIPNDRATFLWCARDAMFHNDDLFDFLQYSRSDCENNDDGYCSDGAYRRGCKLLLCGENPLTKCLSSNGDSCAGY